MNTEKDEVSERTAKHEQRVVGHVSGQQEPMPTCVCGKPWPCDEVSARAARSSTPPILCIDIAWPATPDTPDWVAICAKDWTGSDNYFSLSGHIGTEWGQYVVLAVNSHASLLSQNERLAAALQRQHEWSEKLSKRIRDAVYSSEELKDSLAFKDIDEDFYNGVAASYEAEYAALLATGAL